MNKPVVEVHIRAIVATSGGYAVFLGNKAKVFAMLVDPGVGAAIMMSIAGASGPEFLFPCRLFSGTG
jgi:hypothetical protein